MEVLDLPADRFLRTFGKHSADLSETFLLEIEEASVQTGSDLAVEMLILEFAGGLPDGKLAAAAQRMFTSEDRARLRKRPGHWKVTWNFIRQFFLPATTLSFMGVLMLATADVYVPTEPAVAHIGVLEVLAMLAFAIGAYLDHHSTMDGFRRVDTMERNPLFPRYGFNWIVQAYGTAFMIYVALTFAGPMLFLAAMLKCLAAYGNGSYVDRRLKLTQEELSGLRPEGVIAPAVAELPMAAGRPAAAPARRSRPVRFDYGG